MTRERRQDERRRQRLAKQQQRRQGRPQRTDAPVGGVEFTGVIGWMQRTARWWFLGAILVFVASLGAAQFLSSGTPPTPIPTPEATETPAATDTATATATGSTTPTPSPTPTADPSIRRQYSAPPPMTIDPEQAYTAVITMEGGGEVRIALDPQAAPQAVNNFVFLAQNRFYDGLTFHRVLPGFVAQTGDPDGTGFGSPGYAIPNDRGSLPLDTGAVAMAATAAGAPTVSGSQFFITLAPQPGLQGNYPVFGQVTEGMDVVQGITPRDPDSTQSSLPPGDVISRIEIIEGN